MTKLLQGALDKQEVPIAIDKSAFRIYTHKETRHTILRNMYLWIREAGGGGRGRSCVHEFGILYRRMENKATAQHALSHTSISHIGTPTHTPIPPPPVIVCGVLGNQSKPKRTTEQTKHEPKIHANLVEN